MSLFIIVHCTIQFLNSYTEDTQFKSKHYFGSSFTYKKELFRIKPKNDYIFLFQDMLNKSTLFT